MTQLTLTSLAELADLPLGWRPWRGRPGSGERQIGTGSGQPDTALHRAGVLANALDVRPDTANGPAP